MTPLKQVDKLENKLTEIKLALCNNYKKTVEVKKLCDIPQNDEEYNNHDYADNTLVESQSVVIEEVQEDKDYAAKEDRQEREEEEPFVEAEASFEEVEVDEIPFTQRSHLQTHTRTKHYNDRRFKCDDCGKCFNNKRLLDYHIKAAHTGERPYKCDICTSTFVRPEHFKRHKSIHTGEKPYHCEVCGKAFNRRDNRNAHRFKHRDKKPYKCLVCGIGFRRKPLFYAHMQVQDHINDYTVVNQLCLTTDDDQVITIQDNGTQLLMEEVGNGELDETGLYVIELKDHVIIQREGEEQMYNEEDVLNIPEEETVSGEVDLVVENQMDFTESEEI